MSFRNPNPNYTGPSFPSNARQPRALPTSSNLQQIVQIDQTKKAKLAPGQKSPNPPAIPQDFMATVSGRQIQLSWDKVTTPGTDGYILEVSSDSGFGANNITSIPLASPSQTHYTDSPNSDGLTLYYRVRATAGTASFPQSVLGQPTGIISATNKAQPLGVLGTTVSPTTASTSFVDLAQMTITLSTSGGKVLILFSALVSNNTINEQVFVQLLEDGGVIGIINKFQAYAADAQGAVAITQLSSPAAGTHTYKIQWKVSAGTGTANSTNRALQVIELG